MSVCDKDSSETSNQIRSLRIKLRRDPTGRFDLRFVFAAAENKPGETIEVEIYNPVIGKPVWIAARKGPNGYEIGRTSGETGRSEIDWRKPVEPDFSYTGAFRRPAK
jgi:hypothetical protein